MQDYLKPTRDLNDPVVASAFDELSFWSARFGALLVDQLDFTQRADRVLDLGCGAGFPLLEIAQSLGRSSTCIGADVWWPAVQRADHKRRIFEITNAALTLADGAHLPFAAGWFDLIVSNLGVNNFADPPAALRECARVTRSVGRIVLTTNTQGHMAEFYAMYRDVLSDIGREGYLDRLDAQERHRVTPESLCGLLEQAGFSIMREVEDRFTIRYRDGSTLLRHSLTRYGFLDGWRSVVDPADEALVFAELEARMNTLAKEYGEFSVTVPMLYVEAVRE